MWLAQSMPGQSLQTIPPTPNAPAPINVSTFDQTFEGSKTLKMGSTGSNALGINGALGVLGVFEAFSTAIFDGNVGIGTNNPSQRLDVAGNIRQSLYPSNVGQFWMTGGGVTWALTTGIGGTNGLNLTDDSGGGSNYTMTNHGNVGIGTAES